MAVKFISIKCPECGANLPMEEGRKLNLLRLLQKFRRIPVEGNQIPPL